MSPQMKEILLSFKKLHFKPNTSQHAKGLKSLDEEEQDLNFSHPTDGSCQIHSSSRSKVFFSWMSQNQGEGCQFEQINSTMQREKVENIREAFSVQSNGAVRQRRRSWVVSKHILARSNTVDSLQLQKCGDFCCSGSTGCKESLEVRSTGAQVNSDLPAKVVTQYTFEKRIKPKSASVVSSKPLSPALNPRKFLYRSKTGRVGIKPSSAVANRGRATTKTDSMWEKMSEERKFLINKWLAPQDL